MSNTLKPGSPLLEQLEPRLLLSTTLLSEGFEGAFPEYNGWAVGDSNGTGTTAYWNDVDSAFGGEATHSGNWKGYCAGIGHAGTPSAPTYQKDQTSYMSKSINLSGYSDATLTFWDKMPSLESGVDLGRVCIDSTLIYSLSSTETSWTSHTISLNSYVGGSHTLKFEFYSDYSVTGEGWYLDDILVTASDPDLAGYDCYVTPVSDVTWGQTLSVQSRIENYGGTTVTAPFYVDYHLSNDTVWGNADDYSVIGVYPPWWCYDHQADVPANGYGPDYTVSLTLPSTAPAGYTGGGPFYILMYTDMLNQIAESNETNNIPPSQGQGWDYDAFTMAMDPNDQIAEAISTSVGSTVSGTISPAGTTPDPGSEAGDVDMFSVSLTSGITYAFDIDNTTGSGLDSYIRLFNASGTQLSSNDDGTGPAPENSVLESYLTYTPTTSGTYYLGVSGLANTAYNAVTGTGDTSGSTGGYTLTVDVVDPDDQISEAHAVTLGVPTAAYDINPNTDVDMFSVSLTAWITYGFDIDNTTGSGLDSYIRLFNGSGTELDSNDDGTGPAPENSVLESYLTYTPTTTGTYYLGVSALRNASYDPSSGTGDSAGYSTGGYNLTVAPLPDLLGTYFDASPEWPVPGNGQTSVSYTVTNQGAGAAGASTVSFYLSRNDGAIQTSDTALTTQPVPPLAVGASYNGSVTLILGSVNSGDPCFASNEYWVGMIVDSTGAVPELNETNNSNRGQLLDEDNLKAEGQLITPINLTPTVANLAPLTLSLSTPVNGNIDGDEWVGAYDIDTYRFQPTTTQSVNFDVTGSFWMHLYDSSMNSLLPGALSHLEYPVTAGQTYYLAVRGNGSGDSDPRVMAGRATGSTGAYTLTCATLPDLAGFDCYVSPTSGAIWGQTLSVQSQILNYGGTTVAPSFYVDYHLSNDTVWGNADDYSVSGVYPAGWRYDHQADVPANIGYGPEYTVGLTLPSTAPAGYTGGGPFYILMKTDATNAIAESDETNNFPPHQGQGWDYDAFTIALDPNDQIAEAISTSVGSTVSGTISPAGTTPDPGSEAGDVDMFSVSLTAGVTYGFDIDRPTGALDSYIRLFNASGTELSSNDDGFGPAPENSSLESYLTYTPTTSGTYYLGVSALGNGSYNPSSGTGDSAGYSYSTGGYTLTVDTVDLDDQISEAHPVTISVPTAAYDINPNTDVDMFSVNLTADLAYGFDIDNTTGSGLDSYIRLFNSSGTQLSSNDDWIGPAPENSVLESYLTYSPGTSGTYYLGVSGLYNTAYNPLTGTGDTDGTTGGYTLTVDVVDPDDQISEASGHPVSIGTPATGAISNGWDVDMFAVTVFAGQHWGIDIDDTGGSMLDSRLRLFNASGTELAANDDGVGPAPEYNVLESYLTYGFAVGGTYYIGVSGFGNPAYNPITGTGDSAGSTGGYTLTVTTAATVAGRYIFYNNSSLDGNNPAANAADDAAIATDKVALLPGGTPSSANHTCYSGGINGIMLDIAGLAGIVTASDFVFTAGNTADPSSWSAAPAPLQVATRSVAGANRVTVVWNAGAITTKWLKVKVLSDAHGGHAGLAADDVFYYGNLPGDCNYDRTVDVRDLAILAFNYNRVGVGMANGDFNVDGRVDVQDLAVLAFNYNRSIVPLMPPPGAPLMAEGILTAKIDSANEFATVGGLDSLPSVASVASDQAVADGLAYVPLLAPKGTTGEQMAISSLAVGRPQEGVDALADVAASEAAYPLVGEPQYPVSRTQANAQYVKRTTRYNGLVSAIGENPVDLLALSAVAECLVAPVGR